MNIIYDRSFFMNTKCDIETKFAKFYKIKSGNKESIIKIFKEPYKDFFSSKKYYLLKNLKTPLMIDIEYINEADPFYVQYEYFESMTLKSWLQANNEIDKNTLLSVLTNMAEVIDFFHINNLAHLDIVGNFLINKQGYIKLNDYDYVEQIDGKEIYKIDLHSFFELVYRLIFFLDRKQSTNSIELKFNNIDVDYTSCKKFLDSLNIR
ncbi:protein kinase [Providencia manganoxydans]|uniref:protein kinase domain-containing protein n=2 Tax=Providencia manganoxydans TaxID=2923283 RepID=UPI0029C11ECE|nr:protein kinase [Providencia manganoxydans]